MHTLFQNRMTLYIPDRSKDLTAQRTAAIIADLWQSTIRLKPQESSDHTYVHIFYGINSILYVIHIQKAASVDGKHHPCSIEIHIKCLHLRKDILTYKTATACVIRF